MMCGIWGLKARSDLHRFDRSRKDIFLPLEGGESVGKREAVEGHESEHHQDVHDVTNIDGFKAQQGVQIPQPDGPQCFPHTFDLVRLLNLPFLPSRLLLNLLFRLLQLLTRVQSLFVPSGPPPPVNEAALPAAVPRPPLLTTVFLLALLA